jgi:hypothetical protein
MKIVYIIDRLDGDCGGTESQLIKMIGGLIGRGNRIMLICLEKSKWFEENRSEFKCETKVIPITKYGSIKTYLNILQLITVLNRSCHILGCRGENHYFEQKRLRRVDE